MPNESEQKRSAKPPAKALSYKMETLQKEQQSHMNKIKGLIFTSMQKQLTIHSFY